MMSQYRFVRKFKFISFSTLQLYTARVFGSTERSTQMAKVSTGAGKDGGRLHVRVLRPAKIPKSKKIDF